MSYELFQHVELREWKNNETRLNETNMNELRNALQSTVEALKDSNNEGIIPDVISLNARLNSIEDVYSITRDGIIHKITDGDAPSIGSDGSRFLHVYAENLNAIEGIIKNNLVVEGTARVEGQGTEDTAVVNIKTLRENISTVIGDESDKKDTLTLYGLKEAINDSAVKWRSM